MPAMLPLRGPDGKVEIVPTRQEFEIKVEDLETEKPVRILGLAKDTTKQNKFLTSIQN